MKPKTLDSILHDLIRDVPNIKQAKEQLIELFMSCVPEKAESSFITNQTTNAIKFGFNDCIDQMIKNIEKLTKE